MNAPQTCNCGPVRHRECNGGCRAKTGVLRVNMRQMDRWKVYSDNVRQYDHIVRTHGCVRTLDVRAYLEWLNEFAIFYTFTPES